MLSVEDSPLLLGTLLAAIAFAVVALVGKPYIAFLQKKYLGQFIREDGPQSHQAKAGTPTLGGLLIFLGLMSGLAAFVFLDTGNSITLPTWIVLLVGLVFGGLGFVDDYLKISKKKNKGVSGYTKLAVQLGLGMAVGLYVINYQERSNISVFYQTYLELGWFFPIFATLVITGASNAVNITDGLDGLAGSTMIVALLGASLILYANGYPELAMICAILIGACAGFLLFNWNPAKIFMGDTGSLALGGILGAMMVLGDAELWLLLIGIIFVIEALSVMLQVGYFKLTQGQRLFKMAPIHHHFELSGLKEKQVVYLFTGIQAFAVLLSIFLLKAL